MRLEVAQRLDRSLLWRWQRRFYEREGVRAWSSGVVPWRITSTPRLASAVADLVEAWSADCGDGPPCVVELGAGAGRLAFLVCRVLVERRVVCRYLMTDAAPSNVEAWCAHSQLAPFFSSGLLDAAVFNALECGPLNLRVSGDRWEPGALPGPLLVVATYLFDSLPHQLWRNSPKGLEEGVVSLLAPRVDESLNDLTWEFEFRPGAPSGFLRGYAAQLPEVVFLVPTGGFAALAAVERLGGGRALTLLVDKGPRTLAQLTHVPFPGLAKHGCVSASVNFHALRAWAGWRGWLEPKEPIGELGTYAVISGGGRAPETTEAFDRALGGNQLLGELFETDSVAGSEAVEPAALLKILRSSSYSPDVFLRISARLREAARVFPPGHIAELVESLDRVWLNTFAVGPEDIAFEVATVLQRIGQLSHAVRFYRRSAKGAPHPATHFNLALCSLDLGHRVEARTQLERVLELAPTHGRARELLARLSGPALDRERGRPPYHR